MHSSLTDTLQWDADLSGRTLAGYRLLRRLGRGAMAEVYLAEQLSLRRQVAIKVLRSALVADESYVRRFHLEAQAAASLVHSNIVQIYEVSCAGGIHFIAQEYVAGSTLNEFLARQGSPSGAVAVRIIRQIAAALDKAAQQGIVHRDIKPENILLTPDGDVKVADFGLARLSGSESNLTQIGMTMGTPAYMSPEQVEGKPLDARSDIYSLGVTAYHLLAGEPPFRGETALAVAVQHLNTQPPPLDCAARPDLDAALCGAVAKMLAKDPAQRYQSPRELLDDLRRIAPGDTHEPLDASAGVQLNPNAGTTARLAATQKLAAVMQADARPAGRRRIWLLPIGLAAAFAGGIAIAWLTREAPLLATAPAVGSQIERRNSAEAQYLYASMLNSEAAWLSVGRYFPHDEYMKRRAQQQLARWYLQHQEYAKARAVFDEFAAMPTSEPQFRAFGLAGQAIVLSLQGRHQESAGKLADLWPLRQELDPQLRLVMRGVLRRNRRALSDAPGQQWWQWLNAPDDRGPRRVAGWVVDTECAR